MAGSAAYQRDPLTYAVSFYDAAMLLADMGAEVVKVEPPAGDPLLGLVSVLAPIITSGNACVLLASREAPLAAITLAEEIVDNLDRKDAWKAGLTTWDDGHTDGSADHKATELLVNSVRHDEVPGIHSVIYDSAADCITLTHDAHSRRGFALGAVLAAEGAAEVDLVAVVGRRVVRRGHHDAGVGVEGADRVGGERGR